jgi:hypothetical protein
MIGDHHMRELQPGAKVRVEFNAEVIGLADPSNPYWYTVRYLSGELDTVSLARIHAVVDHTPAVMDSNDCSIQVFSPRLSAEGALDLLLWLETHRHEFEAVTRGELDGKFGQERAGFSAKHEHLA